MARTTSSANLFFGLLRMYKVVYLLLAVLVVIMCVWGCYTQRFGLIIIWIPFSIVSVIRLHTYSLTPDALVVHGFLRKKPLKTIPYAAIHQIVPVYLNNGKLYKLRISYTFPVSAGNQVATQRSWIEVTSEIDLQLLWKELQQRMGFHK